MIRTVCNTIPRRRRCFVLVAALVALSGCGDRLAQREGESQLVWGERLSGQLGCPACHSLSGARLQGPPLGQPWLGEVRLRTGEVVIRDEEYIRNSIVSPASQVLDDYFPVMVPYADLTDDQLDALVAFWKDRSLPLEPGSANPQRGSQDPSGDPAAE